MLKHAISLTAIILFAVPAFAAEDTIGEVVTSGLIQKERLQIQAFDDPTIDGIACYVTLAKTDYSLTDPTDSSIACRKVGPLKGALVEHPDVFRSSKSFFFKTLRVDRFYDAKRNVLVYLSYTTKASGQNHAHSISVVPVGEGY
jgi:CreA protein